MSEPDIVSGIWARTEAAGLLDDLSTAERRKALDDALRAELAAIGDASLRSHAAEMIRERRAKAMFPVGVIRPWERQDLWRRIGRLETVVAALERAASGVKA